jgi:hypothetical protein
MQSQTSANTMHLGITQEDRDRLKVSHQNRLKDMLRTDVKTRYHDWTGRWVDERSRILGDENWYQAGPRPKIGDNGRHELLLVTAVPDLSKAEYYLRAYTRGTATMKYVFGLKVMKAPNL